MAAVDWLIEKNLGVPTKIHAKPHVTTLGRYADSGASSKHYTNEGGFLSMPGQPSSNETPHLKSRRRVECGRKYSSLQTERPRINRKAEKTSA
jgi:hypothetical protein